jgi:hypothetical protein
MRFFEKFDKSYYVIKIFYMYIRLISSDILSRYWDKHFIYKFSNLEIFSNLT